MISGCLSAGSGRQELLKPVGNCRDKAVCRDQQTGKKFEFESLV